MDLRKKTNNKCRLKLRDGANVFVIGGGPAGSFFAYLFLKAAKELNLKINLTIYDGRTFTQYGQPGCNMCAGILGTNLINLLNSAGYALPENVIRHEVTGFTFHFKDKSVQLWQNTQNRIVTVYRGIGPYPGTVDKVSFDQYLLEQAINEGALYRPHNIEKISMKDDGISIQYPGNNERADLLVGAFGVNSNLSRQLDFGYIPPKSWNSCQAEFETGFDFTKDRLRNNVHIFNIGSPVIRFIAIVPKGNFISVTGIGPHVRIDDLQSVLKNSEIAKYLPSKWKILCHCHPKLPVTPARNPYHGRIVMIGDACNSRYLKNGIESAFFTARIAACTALAKGISREIFHRYYYRETNRLFNFDNACGKLLFSVNNFISRKPLLGERFINYTIREKKDRPAEPQITSRILWNMFTGDIPYRDILLEAVHAKTLFILGVQFIMPEFKILKGIIDFFRSKRADRTALPYRIAIIGGGPAGASCAIKLLDEAKKINRDIKVTIYEGKDFERHYNQCVGVLSPPLEEVLNKELGITLPQELIKRTLLGYKLHSDKEELLLSELGGYHTYTVRRVKFDEFMMTQAIQRGAVVVNSRVTNVEFINKEGIDEVRVYCESGYEKADVVVAASGVDETILRELEKATKGTIGFRAPPRFMDTIVTKIHTDPLFISGVIGNYVHAFLLSGMPRIEFGAVTPKADHIIINIAGKNITSMDMDNFLKQPQVKKFLPEIDFDALMYFKGKFPISSSRNPFGHRFVAVGDVTGWLRPFKGKGINTAVITGLEAALVIMHKGITKEAFSHYKNECENLTEGYYLGVIARLLCRVCKTVRLFDPIIRFAKMDLSLYDILYQSVSGETLFKDIFRKLLNPRLLCRMFIEATVRHRLH